MKKNIKIKVLSVVVVVSVSFIVHSLVQKYNVVKANNETINIELNILPGALVIGSFPSTIVFENYVIGLNKPSLKLKNSFEVVVDDFTGSYAGWNLSISVGSLVNGTNLLEAPTLMSDFTNLTVNGSDDNGLKDLLNIPPNGTFNKTDGPVLFNSPKKIISGQAGNMEAVSRHFFNFPNNALQLAFENTIKAGTYTGTTTFTLAASP